VQAQWLRLGGTLAGGRDDASVLGAAALGALEALALLVAGAVLGVAGATAASAAAAPPRQYIG
jgi:hypothetical protein